jgi:hypothetical protein
VTGLRSKHQPDEQLTAQLRQLSTTATADRQNLLHPSFSFTETQRIKPPERSTVNSDYFPLEGAPAKATVDKGFGSRRRKRRRSGTCRSFAFYQVRRPSRRPPVSGCNGFTRSRTSQSFEINSTVRPSKCRHINRCEPTCASVSAAATSPRRLDTGTRTSTTCSRRSPAATK